MILAIVGRFKHSVRSFLAIIYKSFKLFEHMIRTFLAIIGASNFQFDHICPS